MGHYPIAGWLRTATSYVKRMAGGTSWEAKITEDTMDVVREMIAEVGREDSVRGTWHVPEDKKGVVWCDASCIALGVILEVGGVIAEDAAWLRKKNDANHINVAELEVVMKGINLVLKWDLQEIEVKTDSATVASWIEKKSISAITSPFSVFCIGNTR